MHTPKEAMEELVSRSVSKYKIAKVMRMQPIMVDKFLKGEQRTIRREAADRLLAVFNIEIEDKHVNGFTQEDFKKKHYQSEMYVDEEVNTLCI